MFVSSELDPPREIRPHDSQPLSWPFDRLVTSPSLEFFRSSLDIPARSAPDSRDYSGVLTGKNLKSRNFLIEQNVSNKLTIQDAKGWKYIESGNGPAMLIPTNTELGNSPLDQLYNLKTDFGEKKNVAAEYPKILKRLKKELSKEKRKGYPEKEI